ncbi:uncharacterized protein LOC106646539, partial [Copidosoma floridanum]|uniref:uncharacterized protein LOC106646539 n=1 Tax=Copidosoma floridanum TaxID=29053 RepID=UPI0006C93F5F
AREVDKRLGRLDRSSARQLETRRAPGTAQCNSNTLLGLFYDFCTEKRTPTYNTLVTHTRRSDRASSVTMTTIVEVPRENLTAQAIGRRNAIPIVYTRGTHYEVGFDIVSTFCTYIICVQHN